MKKSQQGFDLIDVSCAIALALVLWGMYAMVTFEVEKRRKCERLGGVYAQKDVICHRKEVVIPLQ